MVFILETVADMRAIPLGRSSIIVPNGYLSVPLQDINKSFDLMRAGESTCSVVVY